MKTKIEKAVTGGFTNEYFRFGKGKTPLVILPGVSVQSVMLFADAIEEAYAPLADGFDIYVGKNNIQNEELTFKLAEGNDWWFHAKGVPGSHVVLKTGGREVPDRAFEEAAALAAKYSSASNEGKVSVDYLLRKNVKKPGGSRPGFVVYYTNYSMIAEVSKAPC